MDWTSTLQVIAALGGVGAIVQGVSWAIRKFTQETTERLIIGINMHSSDTFTVEVQWVGTGPCWDVTMTPSDGIVVFTDPLHRGYLAPGETWGAQMGLYEVSEGSVAVSYRPHNKRHIRDRIYLSSGEVKREVGPTGWRQTGVRRKR